MQRKDTFVRVRADYSYSLFARSCLVKYAKQQQQQQEEHQLPPLENNQLFFTLRCFCCWRCCSCCVVDKHLRDMRAGNRVCNISNPRSQSFSLQYFFFFCDCPGIMFVLDAAAAAAAAASASRSPLVCIYIDMDWLPGWALWQHHLQSVWPYPVPTFATLEPLFMQIKTVAHGPLRSRSVSPSPSLSLLFFVARSSFVD